MKNKGIVIGKFYPPHKGHGYLIEYAKQRVNTLTVIICHHDYQKISGTLRAKWIKQIYPDIKVLVVKDIEKDNDSLAWAKYTKSFLGYVPDIVFTSENYGKQYAKFLGCKHILVDKERKNISISATKIRKNPLKYWDYMEPCVRAYFAKRICVVGAESTGTTTIAKELAKHYKTCWVPEFGRFYSEAKMTAKNSSNWDTDEFQFIAKKQNEIEDYLVKKSNKILICDTDSFATSLWHERYMGFISKKIDKLNAKKNYDLYLLTDDNIPFVQDGTRDGKHIRHKMHERFKEELKKRQKNFLILSGSRKQRRTQAIKACDKILKINNYNL